MAFHRTPAEMADDISYARSPIGESASRHMLWLTAKDLAEIGEEPDQGPRKINHDDPAEVAASREKARLWGIWWNAVSVASSRRQREARSDDIWMAEYIRLLTIRKEQAPAEMAAIEARWDRFEKRHPQRGLSDAERDEMAANWQERWRLAADHRSVSKKNKADPRLADILANLKACDERNDAFIALDWSRPTWDALSEDEKLADTAADDAAHAIQRDRDQSLAA